MESKGTLGINVSSPTKTASTHDAVGSKLERRFSRKNITSDDVGVAENVKNVDKKKRTVRFFDNQVQSDSDSDGDPKFIFNRSGQYAELTSDSEPRSGTRMGRSDSPEPHFDADLEGQDFSELGRSKSEDYLMLKIDQNLRPETEHNVERDNVGAVFGVKKDSQVSSLAPTNKATALEEPSLDEKRSLCQSELTRKLEDEDEMKSRDDLGRNLEKENSEEEEESCSLK